MENYGYEPKSSEPIISQLLHWMKYFEDEYSMLVSSDRHTFVVILVNWLTEKMICCFILRSFCGGIRKCYIYATICKIPTF